MKIKSLKLSYFMGIKELSIDFADSTDIFGDNGSGKTTVFNAVLWLLFDKNCDNVKGFGIKTRDENGKEMTKTNHEVEAVFETETGEVKLRKVYHEIWTKPRGKAVAEFGGNTNDFYIDDEPVKSGEFKKFIASFADEEVFKLCTNPMYFNESLTWQKRRELILKICGEPTFEDVVGKSKELEGLRDLLNGRNNIESIKKVAKSKMAEIKKEIESLPDKISENQRNIVADEDGRIIQELQTELYQHQEGIKSVDNLIRIADTDEEENDLRLRLSEVEREVSAVKLKEQDELMKKVAVARAEREKIDNVLYEISLKMRNALSKKSELNCNISTCKAKRDESIKSFKRVKERVFIGGEITTVCPTCGHEIAEEKIAEARAKLQEQEEAFNLAKATELAEINTNGKKNNELKAECEIELEDVLAIIKNLETEQEKLTAQKLAIIIPSSDGELSEDIKKLLAKKQEVQEKIASRDNDTTKLERLSELQTLREKREEAVSDIHNRIARLQANEKTLARIKELEASEKELAQKYEEYAGQVFLCETYTRYKVAAMNDVIQSKFKLARFKLFSENITNDGVEECCETTYKGVPYIDLNNAARINIGLDIIRTLSEHYGFKAPIFIDNAESVTKFINMGDLQIIKLIVSEKDKALRVSGKPAAIKGVA